jgi:hypothetical protein
LNLVNKKQPNADPYLHRYLFINDSETAFYSKYVFITFNDTEQKMDSCLNFLKKSENGVRDWFMNSSTPVRLVDLKNVASVFQTVCKRRQVSISHRVTRGSMLWSQFFRDSIVFGEKIGAIFWNTDVMIEFLHNLALFGVKNVNFLAKIFLKSRIRRILFLDEFSSWAVFWN